MHLDSRAGRGDWHFDVAGLKQNLDFCTVDRVGGLEGEDEDKFAAPCGQEKEIGA
ncbi:MAG TPA: hypothetical protein PKC22_09785 [Rhodocyclaceae bacterium]|nr:hypothetical protein [Rhodocyclaceae bacterium]